MAPPPDEPGRIMVFPGMDREEVGTSGEEPVVCIELRDLLPVLYVRFDDCFPKWVRILYSVAYVLGNCRLWCVYFHQGSHPHGASPLSDTQLKQLRRMMWVQALDQFDRDCFLADLREYGHGILGCRSEGEARDLIKLVGRPPDFLTVEFANPNPEKKTGKITRRMKDLRRIPLS